MINMLVINLLDINCVKLVKSFNDLSYMLKILYKFLFLEKCFVK